MDVLHREAVQRLFQGILTLQTVEECGRFFEDACTIKEIEEIAQRFEKLKMPEKHIPSGYLRLYAKAAASADRGAVIRM